MSPHRLSSLIVALFLLSAAPSRGELEIGGVNPDFEKPRFLPAEERGSGFKPGERLEFHGGWGIFSNIARIIVSTQEDEENGREAFQILSLASTQGIIRAVYPADTRTETLLDPEQWTLISSRLEGRAGKDDNLSLTFIDYENELVHHTDEIKERKSYVQPLPMAPVLDYMSAVFQMRGLPLEIGRSFPVFVQGGGDFYLVHVEVTGIEEIKTAMGRVSCYILEPRMDKPTGIFARGGGVTLWITDDAHRLPIRADVRLGFGTARLRLDRYESPDGQILGKDRVG